VIVGLLVGLDLGAAPRDQWLNRGLLAAIGGYQAVLSPRLAGAGVRCRFEPTCSHYAVGALESHGALSGSLRAAWRVLRCNPLTPAGTVDPP